MGLRFGKLGLKIENGVDIGLGTKLDTEIKTGL